MELARINFFFYVDRSMGVFLFYLVPDNNEFIHFKKEGLGSLCPSAAESR